MAIILFRVEGRPGTRQLFMRAWNEPEERFHRHTHLVLPNVDTRCWRPLTIVTVLSQPHGRDCLVRSRGDSGWGSREANCETTFPWKMPLRDRKEQGAKWDKLQWHGGVTSSWSNDWSSSVRAWVPLGGMGKRMQLCVVGSWQERGEHGWTRWVPALAAAGATHPSTPKGSGLHRPSTGETNHSRFLQVRVAAPWLEPGCTNP